MDKYYHCPYCIIRETGAEEGNLLKVTNMPEEQQGQYLQGAQQGFKSRYLGLQVLNTQLFCYVRLNYPKVERVLVRISGNPWFSTTPFKGSKHKIKGYPP